MANTAIAAKVRNLRPRILGSTATLRYSLT